MRRKLASALLARDEENDALLCWSEYELRAMDCRFRAQVWAALAAGRENCATAVSTVPSTKNPIVGYQRPD